MESSRADRLKFARERAGLASPREAARHFRWNENTYKAREGGLRDYTVEDAKIYARAFDVSWVWLVSGEGDIERGNTVAVIGRIGAGGAIDVASEHLSAAEPLFEIEVPFPVPHDAFALEVKGESMWPRYDDGDVIICIRQSQDPEPLIGWEAAVGTGDGNRYLKKLMRGAKPGRYDLESHNAPPIRNVIISWVSEVFGVVRASRWRRLDDKARRRAIKKAVT